MEKKIAKRLGQLGSIGAMRPGSLNKQYRDKESKRPSGTRLKEFS